MSGVQIPQHILDQIEKDAEDKGLTFSEYDDYFEQRVNEIFDSIQKTVEDAKNYESEEEYDLEVQKLADKYTFED